MTVIARAQNDDRLDKRCCRSATVLPRRSSPHHTVIDLIFFNCFRTFRAPWALLPAGRGVPADHAHAHDFRCCRGVQLSAQGRALLPEQVVPKMRCLRMHQAAETNRISSNVRNFTFCHFLVSSIRLKNLQPELRSRPLCSPVVAVAIECAEHFLFVSFFYK